jgi:hypothetical protein
MNKKLLMILLVVLTLSACDIDDNPYQEQREETSDVDIARVLQNTMSYFKKNGNDFSYLSTRGYEANDLRYKFSRLYRLNGNIIVQTPVVKRPHGSTAMIDSLKNEPVRTYTFTLLNPMYEIQKIAFAEQTPEAAYYIANRNRIFYDKFSGEQKDFATDNSIGNIIKYIDGIEIKTRGLKDTTIDLPEFVCTADSICDPNDTACFAGVILDDDTLGFGSDENTYGDGTDTNGGGGGDSPQTIKERHVVMAKKVSSYAKAHAGSTSQGKCAQYVREALEAIGFKINRPYSVYNGPNIYKYKNGAKTLIWKHGESYSMAKDYGPSLMGAGFSEITPDVDYKPQDGDIRVFPSPNGNHPAGHIDIWDGQNWVSDFVEWNKIPGTPYKKDYNNYNYRIYRCTNK